MVEYQIYQVEKGGLIMHEPTFVKCASDTAAVIEAQKLLDGKAVEVWQESRLVAHLVPKHD
jgi:hypothetical protein